MIEKLRRGVVEGLTLNAREYVAQISGLQIVFGAVLGFVLAGAENFSPFNFGVLLLVTITAVVSILFISASRHRLAYAALALGYTTALPSIVMRITDVAAPDKLAPTLWIWALFQIAAEFLPREDLARDKS